MLSRPRDSSRWWRLGMYSFTSSPNTPSEKKIVKKNWWQLGTLTFIWQYTIFIHTYTHACIYVHTHTEHILLMYTSIYMAKHTQTALSITDLDPPVPQQHECYSSQATASHTQQSEARKLPLHLRTATAHWLQCSWPGSSLSQQNPKQLSLISKIF